MSVTATSVEEWLEQLALQPADIAALSVELEHSMRAQVEATLARVAGGERIIPVVAFDEIVAGTVPESTAAAIRSTGCAVVRGTFEREQAVAWDAELGDYLDRNRFWPRLVERYPAATDAARIWPIYWSRPQVLARQHPRMAATRAFLNGFWHHGAAGQTGFDPAHDIGYPDRIRRRQPGAAARGLAPHLDSPVAGGWRIPENQRVFAPLLTGGLAGYDAFDATDRTGLDVQSPVSCTVFRTFQGWTALSEMHPDDGVLHVVPIPAAAGYRLLRGVAGELGLAEGGPVPAPSRDHGDDLLLRALVPIPAVTPGDTVWWHADLYHSVAGAANDTRWGNVMYIGAAPSCPRNDAYAASMLARFEAGASPLDFPADDFEADFVGRATVAELSQIGRRQFGLDRRPA